MDELWSKAQTRHSIIERSGTKFNSAIDPELALRDAETRLQSGGGLFGGKGISFSGILNNNKNTILFFHLAGKIVIDEIRNNLNDNIIVPKNYSMYGNLVSTSIPNLINKNWKTFKKRKTILFSGFGVGLSQTHLLFSR